MNPSPDYRVFVAAFALSARIESARMLSANLMESDVGAGAMAGVVVSLAGVSPELHAATAKIAATRAMRFM